VESSRNKTTWKTWGKVEDNIEMDVKEIGWDREDWIHVAE
jgi:hypothetical protein